MLPQSYETVSEAVSDLTKRGYTSDFEVLTDKNCLSCKKTAMKLSPDDFEIDKIYRFEGDTDPGDSMIVLAISSKKHQLKGVIVNAFGVYSDSKSSGIIERLREHID